MSVARCRRRKAGEGARALRDDCLTFFPSATVPCIADAGSSRAPLAVAVPVASTFLRSRYRRRLLASSGDVVSQRLLPMGLYRNGAGRGGGAVAGADARLAIPGPRPPCREIAHKWGEAGDFYNVTWPGYVGTLTGMAPGRLPPLSTRRRCWRRTRHPWLRPVDIAANAHARHWRIRHIPPDQLLRQVFETCSDF